MPFGLNSVRCMLRSHCRPSAVNLDHSEFRGGPLRYRIAFLAVLFSSLCTFAQSNYAVLTGSILDPQGQAVAGASVDLKATATAAVRHVTTTSAGLYEIPGLQPGSFELRVTAPGFGTSAQPLQL